MKRLESRAVGKEVNYLMNKRPNLYRVVGRDLERVDRRDIEIRQFDRINLIVQSGMVVDAFIG